MASTGDYKIYDSPTTFSALKFLILCLQKQNIMDTLSQFKNELEAEYQTTRKFFETYPEEKNDFAPHEKSMKMLPLATHIAEIFEWPNTMLSTSELDFGSGIISPSNFLHEQISFRLSTKILNWEKKLLKMLRKITLMKPGR